MKREDLEHPTNCSPQVCGCELCTAWRRDRGLRQLTPEEARALERQCEPLLQPGAWE